MERLLATSLVIVVVFFSVLIIPQASALPVTYNQTALNFGLTSVPRNSSSYDVFTLNQDNWLWEKFDNNTIDSGALSIPSTITYNSNLKALWSFQNSLSDSSTNGNNLSVLAGSAVYDTGHEGQGFKFNGATDLQATNNAGLQPTAFSVSFWVYLTSTQSPFSSYILKYSNGANGQWFFDSGPGTTSNIRFAITTSNGEHSTPTTNLSLNTWHHIVGTYDGTTNANTVILYVDGSQSQTTTSSGTWTPSGNTNNIIVGGGDLVSSGTREDEIRFYNTNISAAQVSALDEIGHYSQSHTFDGGEYVSLGTSGSLNFERTNPFSISTWIKTTSTSFHNVFTKGISNAGGASYGIGLGLYSSGTIDFDLSGSDFTSLRVAALSTTVNDGNWHYVAITYDGTSTPSGIKIYIDGNLQTSTTEVNTLDATILNSFSPIIGTRASDFNSPFIGQLDNTKVYPYALSSSQITSDYNSISPISSGKQYMSWYNSVVGSSTLTEKLGSTKSSLSLSCALPTPLPYLVSNTTNIYYVCATSNIIHQINIQSGTDTTYFKIAIPTNGYNAGSNSYVLFKTIQNIVAFMADPSGAAARSATKTVNNTLTPTASSFSPVSNQKLGMSGYEIKYNTNSSTISNSGFTTNACEINYTPTTTEKSLDSIACDIGLNPSAIKYWNGMNIQGTANYATNSTQQFLSSIDASQYKKLLSVPCAILVNEQSCVTFIMTDYSNTDYFIVVTPTHVYYKNAQAALAILQNNNYALQSYDIITPTTSSAFEIPNPILQSMTLYGFNINTTVTKTGLFTLPSGYSVRSTIVTPSVRTIDPRWTDDTTDIPIITSTSSLFPIYLTASNAPSFSAIKVTSAQQIINNQEAVWSVAQLDSTRSVEFDLPPGVCANIYIADISVSPTVWNFEGIICATGVNQKTVAYTNTVPFTFYTLKYGVTDSYVPANNGLQTTFRTQAAPTTYTVIVRNSTGTVAINQTFTIPANQTIDTRTFNVSSVSKPASLAVSVGGNMVYSSYLGSSLSLATVSSFFHQYFSYQGFDLASFIPIVFCAAFTRNTVGVGAVLVVLMIATLSWLSVTVVPEPVVYVSIFIAILSMIGYRAYGY